MDFFFKKSVFSTLSQFHDKLINSFYVLFVENILLKDWKNL